MTSDKGIPIKNVYYMLSYAFHALQERHYEDIAGEEFEGAQDLFAAILAKGLAHQLKRGLHREYVPRAEDLPLLRGRLDVPGTIRQRAARRRLLSCGHAELAEDDVLH
ncbi:MAG: 5-methylcytosine-specific restriction endonuclease system specificity protein McrC, partial [Synergistaceae bacterium]|nr:5-methylcytosine-specific restriction endonuclease system specificity protein McrC [Synergistaceae bacterium]